MTCRNDSQTAGGHACQHPWASLPEVRQDEPPHTQSPGASVLQQVGDNENALMALLLGLEPGVHPVITTWGA